LTLKYVKSSINDVGAPHAKKLEAAAKGECDMTPKQTTLGQPSFAQVAPVAETAAPLFFYRLSELDPSLRGLFAECLHQQRMKLMAILTTAINNLHQRDAVALPLRQRGLPHVGYRRETRRPRRSQPAGNAGGPTNGNYQSMKSA
jgi:hypothetical protein